MDSILREPVADIQSLEIIFFILICRYPPDKVGCQREYEYTDYRVKTFTHFYLFLTDTLSQIHLGTSRQKKTITAYL